MDDYTARQLASALEFNAQASSSHAVALQAHSQEMRAHSVALAASEEATRVHTAALSAHSAAILAQNRILESHAAALRTSSDVNAAMIVAMQAFPNNLTASMEIIVLALSQHSRSLETHGDQMRTHALTLTARQF